MVQQPRYFFIDSEADLQRTWNRIIAGKPDFIKTFLAHSEEFGRHRDASNPNAHTGLDPNLLPVIVKTAHREGLRVSSHVETATDFRNAVRAGVDEIAHLPGWWVPNPESLPAARLTTDDAQNAATAEIVVVTTTVAGRMMPGHTGHSAPERHQDANPATGHSPAHQSRDRSIREVQRDNLELLHRHGVRIAIGSDHADTSLSEAMNLWTLKIFDNLTLLKMWCETTPAIIFPQRRIGHLEEGYEASFLVLMKNPLENFDHVTTITMRFKQGHFLGRQP